MKTANQFIFLTILTCAVATQAAIVPAPDDQEEPSVVANGNGYFVVWADKRTYGSTEYDIYGARVSSTGEVLDPAGIRICTDPGRQTSPRVAFDGERYLVVWEDDRESTSAFQLYQIYGARVTANGQVLDPNGFKITTNRVTRLGPAVASDGQGFFVAWGDWHRTDGAIEDVYGSPVSSDGVVANPDGIPLVLGAGWQGQPRIAFVNGEYLMTYRDSSLGGPDIWGIRVSTAGQPLSSVFRISNSGQEAGGRYGLTSNGRDCLVVWGDHRGSPSGFGYPKIYGTLVRSNGVVVSPNGIPIATNSLYQDRPRIASDGNNFLVVWQESNDAHEEFTDVYAAKLTTDGSVGTPARIAVNRAPGVQFNPDVAFSAGNYLVAWQDGRSSPDNSYPLGAFDVYGSLVSGGGVVSNEDGFLITAAPSNRPPEVSIVTPSNGAAFTAPASVTLIAHADDQDGYFTIQTVEFFANNVSLGIRTNFATMNPIGPFFLVWTNVPAGQYTLTAKATDDHNAQTVSSPVKILVDSGKPVVNVEALKVDAYELGDSKSRALIFQVTRTGPTDFELPVSYRVGGTAQNGVDYEELSGRLIIPIGAMEAAILTYARLDEISESDETVEVAIERPSCNDIFPPPRECYQVGEHGATRGLIHDAPPPPRPVVSLELVDPNAAETLVFQNNIDWAEFRVVRTGDLSRELVVFLNTQQGSARLGEDYRLDGVLNGSSVRIPAGTNSVNVRLYPIDDDFYEGDESVFFHLIAPPFGTPLPDQYDINLAHSSVAMVIHDNDPITTRLEITAPRNGQHFEAGSVIELRSQIVGPGSSNILWSVEFFDGDRPIGTTRPGGTIWWDNAIGGEHIINARATSSTDAMLLARPVTIFVGSGPAWPVVSIVATGWRTAEPCPVCLVAPGVFTLSRTGPTNEALTVYLQYDGTATPGQDYVELPRQIVIPAGKKSAEFLVLPTDDALAEGPEIVRAKIALPELATRGYIASAFAGEAMVVIGDDEAGAPELRLDIVEPEGGAQFALGITIQISALGVWTQGEVDRPVEFYSDNLLIGRSDPPALGRPTIPGLPSVHSIFWTNPPPGQHVLTARFEHSPGQAVTSPPVNITVGPSTLTVVRLETLPLQTAQAHEFCPPNTDCAYPSFVVRRSGPTNTDLRVYLSYFGTAAAGVDYPPLPDSLVIPAGRDAAFLMVVPKDDTLVEGPETVIARFTPVPGPGYVPHPDHLSATITIIDNERPLDTVVSIAATQRIAEESSEPFRRLNLVGEFTVSRTGPTNNSLSVFVKYSGMATPGADYPSLPQLVTIPSGSVSTVIRVEAINDHVPEGIETLVATLSNCAPGGIDPATGITCFDGFDIDPAHTEATVFIRDDGVTTASLAIIRPQDGTAFNTGDTIHIEAVALDLDGYISRVEFWDGEQKIGVSEIVFIRAPDPGTPIQHSFEWRGAASGLHVLTARTVRADGTSLQSRPVHITVGGLPPADREFHAISFYSGATANGGPSRNNERGDAAVVVNRPGKRVTLFLSSYEPVWWHVTAGNATIIEKVILGGYYRQEIDGIGAGVEIINAYYDEGQGTSNYLWPGTSLDSGRFFRVLQKLCGLVGMDLASFQGTYTATYPAPMVIDQVQNDPRLRCDYPQPVDLSQLPNINFRLAFNDGGSGSVAFQDYTLQGAANAAKLLPAWRVVTDAAGRYYYGADFHESWRVDTQTSTVQQLLIPSSLPEFSWPVGIAFDSQRNRILVATLVGEGYLYAYSPASAQWTLVRGLENEDLDSLVYHPANDSLYGVTTAYYDGGAPSLLRLNANGEVTGEIPLPVQPYGVGTGGFRSELASVGDYLVLLLETGDWVADNGRPEARIYLIDPRNGQVWLTYRKVGSLPNRPPNVTILTPSNGATFNAGADIVLGANVTDPDGNLGAVTKVEFFANETKIGEALGPTTAPIRWVFAWTHVPPGNYTLTARATDASGASSVSAPVRILVSEPAIAIGYPREGDNFTTSTNVPIVARVFVAVGTADFLGTVTNVEFFANHVKLGEMHSSVPDPEPMPPFISFAFTWTNPPPGSYALTAKATTDTGATQTSLPVHVTIGAVKSFVRIDTTQRIAEETSFPMRRLPARGEFMISRSGPTNEMMPVFVLYSGTATPGQDYPYPPLLVTIPAGARSTSFQIVPNDDHIPEGIETVVARVVNCLPCPDPANVPCTTPCVDFNIDSAHESATVFIRDDGLTEASLAITQPREGAVFGSESTIVIEATAIDLNGYISWVEFWDGERKIGDSVIDFFRAPDPGTPINHSFAWREASLGPHVLTARAIRADGGVLQSAPVHITVGSYSLPTVDVAVRDAFAVEPRTNADLDAAAFGIRRVGPTNADLVVSYSLQGTAQNGVDYEKLSGVAVIPAGQRIVNVTLRPLPDELVEQDETVILRLEDSPAEQPPRYFVGLQRRAVAIISDNAPAPVSATPQYLSLANGLPHICFAAESGRTYRIEASSDLRHWESVGVAQASGGALHFVDPEAMSIKCRFYRLAPEAITVTGE